MVAEVINQNQTVQKGKDTVTRLQRSVLAKLETDESNVSKVKIYIIQIGGPNTTKLPGLNLESLGNRK